MKLNIARSYALIANVDKSILGLNPYCKKFGCEIKFIDLSQVEKKFGSLFKLKNIERRQGLYVNIKHGNNISISHEFRSQIRYHIVFSRLNFHDECSYPQC